MDRIWIN